MKLKSLHIMIHYSWKRLSLSIKIGKYYKVLQCPFGAWWKARKYFKRPKFKWYFGPTCKSYEIKDSKFGEYVSHNQLGAWPFASTEFLKWHTKKWFPIYITSWDIGWKDKYDTPRYETPGHFIIFFGRTYFKSWQFSLTVKAREAYCMNSCLYPSSDENYWESMIWYLEYPDKYNEDESRKLDIVNARNSMQESSVTMDSTTIGREFNIVDYGKEKVTVGKNKEEFTYVSINRDIVGNYDIDYSETSYLRNDLSIMLELYGQNVIKDDPSTKNLCKFTRYVHIDVDEDYENAKIKMYFEDPDGFILKALKDRLFKNAKFVYFQRVYLGPSFKDEFLTKRAIKEIKKRKADEDHN